MSQHLREGHQRQRSRRRKLRTPSRCGECPRRAANLVALLLACSLGPVLAVPGVAQAGSAQASTAHEPTAHERSLARDSYLAGARALEHNDLAQAERSFKSATELDPANLDYRIGRQLVLEHRVTSLVQQAGVAQRTGDGGRSAALLSAAAQLDPQNRIIAQHLPAPSTPLLTSETTPIVNQSTDTGDPDRDAGATIGGELRLLPTPGTHSFHLHTDIRAAATEVLSAWGIRATFDDSVTPLDVRFGLDDVAFTQAVPLLLQMGRLFAVPLGADSVLIGKDTAELRTRLERQLEETIYVPGYGTEQLNELGNVLRNIFDIRQLAVANTSGKLVVRAPAATIHAVNILLADLVDGGSEIAIDVELYSVDKIRTRSIGPQFPQQFSAYNVASTAQSLVSSNQSIIDQAIAQGFITLTGDPTTDLLREAVFLIASGAVQSTLLTDTLGFFGGGLTLTGVTAGPATFNFALNSSDTRLIDRVQLRAADRQSAIFRSGTRYPITTSTYSTGVSSTASSALAGVSINGVSASSLLNQFLGGTNGVANSVIPQIQYEDLGLTLKATPVAQKSGEVSMRLDLKIEALAGTALNNIPLLASRQFVSDITVRDGETALMVSSVSRQESTSVSGIPGLGELPGFQSVSADRTGEHDTSELVLLITPHLIRRRSDLTAGPRIAFSSAPDQREN